MGYLTTGQAAKFVGKSRSHIHNMAKKGKISVAKINDKGIRFFDTSELLRVFGERSQKTQIEHEYTGEKTQNTQFMDALKEQIEMLKSDKENLQGQNTRLEEKNEELTKEIIAINKRLLPHPEEKKEKAVIEPLKRKKILGLF